VRGPHDPFVEAIETAQGAHHQPLLIAISTQAATDGDLFSLWLDDAANSADPRIVSHLYTAPKDCELSDRKAWAAANPAMAQFRSQTDIEDFAAQAERLPAKANSFRWLYLNQRIEAQSPFLSRAEWEANNASPNVEHGDYCFAGLDLSASRDLTALVLVFPKADKFHIQPHFFLPSDGLRDKSQAEKTPYDLWADEGFLHTIDGPVIQPAVVAQTVAELAETYDLQLLAYDRWRINDFQRELDNIGAQIPMKAFGQGFRDMSPAVDKLERLVAERKLCHGDHPIMNMCAAGAVVQSDPAGNRKLHKAKSYSKIDGLVALAMALGCMSADDLIQPTSPWDDPDFKLAV
jgi:phage terminase large subunit-like protein